MSETTLLDRKIDISEARARAKDVREQLRALQETLAQLTSDAPEIPGTGLARLDRARLNMARALEEIHCTDGQQSPF